MVNIARLCIMVMAIIYSCLFTSTLTYAESECTSHFKQLSTGTSVGILGMIFEAKRTGTKEKSDGEVIIKTKKETDCIVSLEIASKTSPTSLCREEINTCSTYVGVGTSKDQADLKIKEYEAAASKAMKEKESALAELQKKHPQSKKSFKRAINEKNEHSLVILYTQTLDWDAVKHAIKKYCGYFDNKLDQREARAISISVPIEKSEELVIVLQAIPGIISVEYDTVGEFLSEVQSPNDAFYSGAWHLQKISAPVAWKTSYGKSIGVAVIDSGIDHFHPDLAPNIVRWPGSDTNGHGTKVAGVIAAVGNNVIGVTGVDWNANIYSYYGYNSIDAQTALYATAAYPAIRVINMSVGYQDSAALKQAIDYAYSKGKVLVSAAGNKNELNISYPAAYLNVLSVGAVDHFDTKYITSNYGSFIDVSAPGTGIWTTSIGGGYTNTFSETSAASPIVSGIASLIYSVNGSLSNSSVYGIIKNNTDPIPLHNGYSQSFYGRVNAQKALSGALTTVFKDWDLSGDGVHSLGDVMLTLQKAVNISPTTNADLAHGDIYPYIGSFFYGDGSLNIQDAFTSLQRVVGLI